tara:strand:- start:540 stop:1250 length:711 start_codon:yes stop_codon:yes gene_type:complete
MKTTHQRLMRKLIYITLALSFSALTGCEKDKRSTIEGQFYKDCSQTPIEPTTLRIYGVKDKFLQNSTEKFLGEATTDVRGRLKFESESNENFNGLKFYRGNNLFFWTSYEDKKNFKVYDRVKVSHNAKLMVYRPFTNQDTLILGATLNDTILILPGPFTNNQTIPIIITPNIGASFSLKIEDFREGEGLFWWGLGKEEFKNVSHNPNYRIPPNLIRGPYQNVCGQGGDVIIDLRNK